MLHATHGMTIKTKTPGYWQRSNSFLYLGIMFLVPIIVVRPKAHTVLFWLLTAPCILAVAGYKLLRHLENRRAVRDAADWHRRLMAVVDVRDFEDDGHLHEYFEPAERERLIQELERMPPGSRRLRRAIEIVSPELIDDDT